MNHLYGLAVYVMFLVSALACSCDEEEDVQISHAPYPIISGVDWDELVLVHVDEEAIIEADILLEDGSPAEHYEIVWFNHLRQGNPWLEHIVFESERVGPGRERVRISSPVDAVLSLQIRLEVPGHDNSSREDGGYSRIKLLRFYGGEPRDFELPSAEYQMVPGETRPFVALESGEPKLHFFNQDRRVLVEGNLRWESDNSSIASVDASGLISAHAFGRTTIRVSQGSSLTRTFEVEVQEGVLGPPATGAHSIRKIPDFPDANGPAIRAGNESDPDNLVVDSRGYPHWILRWQTNPRLGSANGATARALLVSWTGSGFGFEFVSPAWELVNRAAISIDEADKLHVVWHSAVDNRIVVATRQATELGNDWELHRAPHPIAVDSYEGDPNYAQGTLVFGTHPMPGSGVWIGTFRYRHSRINPQRESEGLRMISFLDGHFELSDIALRVREYSGHEVAQSSVPKFNTRRDVTLQVIPPETGSDIPRLLSIYTPLTPTGGEQPSRQDLWVARHGLWQIDSSFPDARTIAYARRTQADQPDFFQLREATPQQKDGGFPPLAAVRAGDWIYLLGEPDPLVPSGSNPNVVTQISALTGMTSLDLLQPLSDPRDTHSFLVDIENSIYTLGGYAGTSTHLYVMIKDREQLRVFEVPEHPKPTQAPMDGQLMDPGQGRPGILWAGPLITSDGKRWAFTHRARVGEVQSEGPTGLWIASGADVPLSLHLDEAELGAPNRFGSVRPESLFTVGSWLCTAEITPRCTSDEGNTWWSKGFLGSNYRDTSQTPRFAEILGTTLGLAFASVIDTGDGFQILRVEVANFDDLNPVFSTVYEKDHLRASTRLLVDHNGDVLLTGRLNDPDGESGLHLVRFSGQTGEFLSSETLEAVPDTLAPNVRAMTIQGALVALTPQPEIVHIDPSTQEVTEIEIQERFGLQPHIDNFFPRRFLFNLNDGRVVLVAERQLDQRQSRVFYSVSEDGLNFSEPVDLFPGGGSVQRLMGAQPTPDGSVLVIFDDTLSISSQVVHRWLSRRNSPHVEYKVDYSGYNPLLSSDLRHPILRRQALHTVALEVHP